MKKNVFFLTAVLMVTLILSTGCAKTASNEKLTVDQILSKSYDNMQTVKSFHFVLDQTGGGTPISMGVEMTKAEGDIVKPDKLKTTISGTAVGTSIQVELVTAEGKTLMTNPLSGKWEAPPNEFKVLSIFDPSTGIAAIIKGITNPTKLDDEKVENVLCYHIKGSISSKDLSSITGSSATNVTDNVEVWIDKEGLFVQKVMITGKITDTEKDGIVRTLLFTNYNKDISITLPQ